MSLPILSILTPAVPSRISQLWVLCKLLERQIRELPVEHLVLLDNKRRTVGEKRDALLRAAKGQYIAFVDDDDSVADDYVKDIFAAINSRLDIDVVTFLQKATIDGVSGIIEFRLGNPNEPFSASPARTRRNAWHVCAWRRSLAIQSHFPAVNYGEDWQFAAPLCAMARKEEHIPKILHFYKHTRTGTEAPPPVHFVQSRSETSSYPASDAFHIATGV